MRIQAKPPRKKRTPSQDADPDSTKKGRPAAAERQEQEAPEAPAGKTVSESPDTPSREEVISNTARPITNTDEQEKVTNADPGDIPVANN